MTHAETLLVATYVLLSEQVEEIQKAQEIFYSPQLEDNCNFYLGVLNMCMTIPAEHFKSIFRSAILPRISSLIPRPDCMETEEDRLVRSLNISICREPAKYFYQDICANLAEREERSL